MIVYTKLKKENIFTGSYNIRREDYDIVDIRRNDQII